MLSEEFKDCKIWISKARKNGKTWNEILYAGKADVDGLKNFIESKVENDFWTITVEEWELLVKTMEDVENNSNAGFIGEPPLKPWISAPDFEGSCWYNYKKKLESNNFTYTSIDSIEKSSQKIVSYLSDSTEQNNPVRGMVVGNVQSGKTANMAGVIAMAADYGYNFFIVLTGTIDNLRIQTRNRLLGDLNYQNCSFSFDNLDYLSAKTASPQRLQDLHINDGKKRFITICLKNSTRLRDLLNWINKDQKSKANLKILVIDDEADQAGINTKSIDSIEQTTISRLIKNLVFGRDSKDLKKGNYKAMNYIGYTATPYANFLNESGDDTLYPKNFIALLSTSSEYFGPQQIFGVEDVNEALNIVNVISKDDVCFINDDGFKDSNSIPNSLKEALLWFVITVACFRFWKFARPISMLIHTSQKIEKHSILAFGIEDFFKHNDYDTLKDDILNVYNKQTGMLPIDSFKDIMSDYNNIEYVKDYPLFDEIESIIKEILDKAVSHIGLDDNKTLVYSQGLHLCVDNCNKKKSEDDSIEMRIVYPDDSDPIIKESPAFIVIGGATLSRGLTLQGLTTSYFLRNTNQADTLMQMGRWFGYRKGYELLQRLWLSSETQSRFNRLTRLDYDLRQELYSMEIKGLSPKEYGPRLDSFPDYKLLVITSKKKKQSTIECKTTFYNKSAQTPWLYRDDDIISENYDKTIEFLNNLGDVDEDRIKALKNPYADSSSVMWFDVDYTKVIDYLKNLKIPTQKASFDDYDKLLEWYNSEFDKGSIANWTVIAGGVKNTKYKPLTLNGCNKTIYLEKRTRYEFDYKGSDYYKKNIDLNTISQPEDRIMDIDCSMLSKQEIEEIEYKKNNSNNKLRFLDKRIKYASKTSPLLIIYIVDKDSKDGYCNTNNGYRRYPLSSLNLPKDLVGYYLYIPYGKGESDGYITIKLNYDNTEMDGEVDEY